MPVWGLFNTSTCLLHAHFFKGETRGAILPPPPRHTVLLTGSLTNECEWCACCVVPAHKSISGTHMYPSQVLQVCALMHLSACIGTCDYLRLNGKTLTSLKASYTFTASLALCKVLRLVIVYSQSLSRVFKTPHRKILWFRSLYTPSECFTTSLLSPVFIKKYDRRSNCLLSPSCHHSHFREMIGPRLLYVLASGCVSAQVHEYLCTLAEGVFCPHV